MYDFEIRAKDAVVDALQEMTYHEVNGEGLSYGTSWQLVGEADYLVAYKQPDPTNSSITVGRVFGRVRAELDDVMGLFYSETSEDYLKVSQLLHNRTHDARVLSVIRKRGPTTSPYSFLGTKYLCAEPVAGIPARDQVMVEYMGYAQDSKGRAIGFHATLPLNPQEAPPLGSTMRVPRVRVTNVLLVRALENHPGHCAVFTTGSFDLRESSSNMTLFIRKYMDNLRDVSVLMDSRRISSEQLLGKHSWVPDSLRKSCYVCTRSFGPTRHRHHCRLCGEVVCRKCLVAREFMASGEDGRVGMTKLKVCMFCVQKTRSKTSKSSFGLPGTAMDRSGSPTHTFAHTITSSMDRTSFTSDAYSDASSQFSFDIGFEIRSPSRRYSDMSVATTIFERDDASIADSFAADLYIDTHDMEPAYQPRMPPQYVPQQRPMMSSSPRSSKSSSSGRSGGSGGHSGYSNGYARQPSLQYQQYPRTSAYDRDREHHQESQRFINDIGQQLAEQQEILRRLALASSSNNSRPSHDSRQRY